VAHEEDRQFESGAAAAGHTKRESTVRYLGIEVDDALATLDDV
jgi:NADH:ubiquinone oxidoreductase subunit 3 (subunit A)